MKDRTTATTEDMLVGSSFDHQKSVVFAVNYEVSMVDQFLASERKRRLVTTITTPSRRRVVPLSSTTGSDLENSAPEDRIPSFNISNNNSPQKEDIPECNKLRSTSTPCNSKTHSTIRKSARDRGSKKTPLLARSRVRYDMQLVPPVRRNRSFLQQFFGEISRNRRSGRLNEESNSSTSTEPFLNNDTVVWIPTKRSEWEDSVPEMAALCTAAELRRRRRSSPNNTTTPIHPPLSRDYIRDRIDIDDPLHGYQMRHRKGGWLQGFVLWTNFTTWTRDFQWDSTNPVAGIDPSLPHVDSTGTLAQALESQPRSGDPDREGIVFSTLAEIALVGGLGCGEYVLRMAMERIRAAKQYEYMILQATEASRGFYEGFGFVRVGAICQYQSKNMAEECRSIVGYRHWTHANESQTSLKQHGGPSYMMALKVPCDEDDTSGRKSALFLERMSELSIDHKPTVESLGLTNTNTTPGRKSNSPFKRGVGRPPKNSTSMTTAPSMKRKRKDSTASSCDGTVPPPTKRRRELPTPDKVTTKRRRDLPSPDKTTPQSTDNKSETTSSSTSPSCRSSQDLPPLQLTQQPPKPLDPLTLRKQKVKAYPRCRVHYYNRVVRRKQNIPITYFFVLQYDEPRQLIQLIPLAAKGKLSGKREGRPRYQALVGTTDANWIVQRVEDYVVVKAAMVMKTPVVASEAWDIEE